MGSNMRNLILTLIALIVILGGGYYWYSTTNGNGTTPPVSTTTPPQATSTPPATTASVVIAVLDTAGTSNGKPRACDKVILVPRTVATTTAPLTAALQNLFAISTTSVSGYFNYIARTNATLKFDRATVANGTAHIYLTGSLSGLAGVCDDPRASIQIEETALQFGTVQRVQLYLNNATTTLIPSQR
ncbi:MAG TPA: GerMN domain-containing protein [Candidatus Paceibacterota bacterium]